MNRRIITAVCIGTGIALTTAAPAYATEEATPFPPTATPTDSVITEPTPPAEAETPVPVSTIDSFETVPVDLETVPLTQPTTGLSTATVTLKWFIPGLTPDAPTPTATDPALWLPEQIRFDGTQYGWCQLDTGPADTLPADEFGPTLHKGEDYGWVTSWSFEKCGTVPVVIPELTPEPTPPAVTPETVPTPAPTIQAAPVAHIDAAPALAETGAVSAQFAIPAAGAVVFGILLTALARIRGRKGNA